MRVLFAIVLASCGFSRGTVPTISDGSVDAPRDAPRDASVGGPQDARTEFIFEAETPSAVVVSATHAWTVETTLANASNGAYMRITPANGVTCADFAMIAQCSTELRFDFTVEQAGMYYFYTRLWADSAVDNSVWYGVDGMPEPTALVPIVMQWSWMTGRVYALAPGAHSMSLWHREAGLRADVVALTTSATHP